MNPLTEEIVAETRRHYDGERAAASKRYFREPIEAWGLPMPKCKEIADRFYSKVKGNLPLAIEVAGELHRQRVIELPIIGDYMLKRMRRHITPAHFDTFDLWVDSLTNWATTDTLCTGIIYEAVRKDPRLVERLIEWAGSKNRWRRRAAAVTLVPIARKGDILDDVFRVADRLMEDPDDMAQKGVGWLLKEASKKHPIEVRKYLVRWRPKTTSLILRYASEKLPMDKRVLKRGIV
jgi:3-methyladenine DNA glycosylase AlkD